MLSRKIYPERRGRRILTGLAALFLLVGLLVAAGVALAVHNTGAFELDGNAVSADAPAPVGPADDWDRVCHEVNGSDCSTSSDTTGATAVAWSADCPQGAAGLNCGNLNATIFTGGGSKDPIDINQWAWKDGAGGLPDKDNLLHGFAAQYSLPGTTSAGNCPNGTDINADGTPNPGGFDPNVSCDLIYFGSDRYDNSGDAQQGFWFFQDKIGLGTNSVGGGTGFTGVHQDGDVLVISDFSNGGGTSTITVYKWDASCLKGATKPNPGDCGDANLRLLSTSTNAKCSSTLPGNDNACGIVNPTNGTFAPWPYTDKSGNSTYLNGELYEGGINLSTLGLAGECFSSIGSETRSSTSTTATLKDFILGGFAPCGASLVTDPQGDTVLDGVDGTATVSDDATITVTGFTNPPAPTGSVDFYLCGPSTTQLTSCDATGTHESAINLNTADVNGNEYTVNSGDVTLDTSGYYCWFATWPGDDNYDPSPDSAFSDGSATECFSIRQPTSIVTTLHETNSAGVDVVPAHNGTTLTINAGGYVVDYANLTPAAATGSVAFRYYPSSTACTADTTGSGGTTAGSGNVSGGSAHGSTLQLTAGTYYFKAFYTATANTLFNDSVSDCSEILTVRQPTSIVTTLHETNSAGVDVVPAHNGTTLTINAGGYVVDYANLTPAAATGSVAFRYYPSSTACTADTTGSGGTTAGSGNVSGGSAHGSTLQLTAGTYYFKAFYTATANTLFNDSVSDCSEILTVRQPTSIVTTLHETNSAGVDVVPAHNGTTLTINAGGYVVDYANLTPAAATGSVAFRYYPSSTACTADTTGSGGTTAGSGNVSGGSAHGSTLQLTAGTYYFKAFYTATANTLFNDSVSDCSEILTVNQFNPSLTTKQTVTVTDSMTITAGGGGDLLGTAHFQPFDAAGCGAGHELHAVDDVAVSGPSSQTVASTVTLTFDTAGPHTVYWQVSYTSNNPAQTGIAATCTENTTLTISN